MAADLRGRARILSATGSVAQAIEGEAAEEGRWEALLAPHYRRTASLIGPFTREASKGSAGRERKGLAEELIFAWIEQIALKKSKLIVNGTREIVRELLNELVDEGVGTEEMAREIQRAAPSVARYRAASIARTETHGAASFAALATAKEMEAESAFRWEKKWVAVMDARTRDDHIALDGEVIGLSDTWPIGVAFPGDPEGAPEQVINCRCVEVTGLEGTL